MDFPSTDDTAFAYFQKVNRCLSLNNIAEKLGLHKNTVSRWVEKNNVPKHYLPDLRRLMGKTAPTLHEANDTTKAKDQYYTKPKTAGYCWQKFLDVAQNLDINLRKYHFIEPAAGCGGFYQLLPTHKRIGIDIEPNIKGLIKADFLTWTPAQNAPYIVIGNPPFGLRGHLALQFINHAGLFADVVAFILPQLFASDGKGVPAKRVKNYKLAYCENLPSDSFQFPDGQPVKIHTVFQVWTKINTHKINYPPTKTCTNYVRIYSLSNGGTPASTRNKDMIGKCDVYIPSTCFSGMRAYNSFNNLPNRRGYGIVIHKNKDGIKKLLLSHDWMQTAFPSTNSAINIRKSLIENVVINGGYYDKN